MSRGRRVAVWVGVALVSGAALPGFGAALPGFGSAPPPTWEWDLPPGIAPPRVPADNPMTAEKVELGRHLFYDTRLSFNETQSCASCHRQELAFTDGKPHGVGSTGEVHPRGSMSLANVAYSSTLTWAHPSLSSLEEQQLAPLLGDDPVELGMGGHEDVLLARLAASPVYDELFAAAFPADPDPLTLPRVLEAIASFERTLISFDSPWDRQMLWGERGVVSSEVLAGAELFASQRMGCADCHTEPFFTNAVEFEGREVVDREFFNTGLYDLDGEGAYPTPNTGVHASTGRPADMGRFRAPTLRNIAVTAPYMHDGSIATLDDVLTEHYMPGGRTDSPLKSDLMLSFGLSPAERASVVAFLHALTDERFLTDPRFADPWVERRERPGADSQGAAVNRR